MAGAKHLTRPTRGRVHLLANAVCSALVVVGFAILLAGRATGYAADTPPNTAVLDTGRAVVPNGLHPGADFTGRLPVSNTGAYDAQVTDIAFDLPVADADHEDCRVGSVVLTAAALPVVPRGTSQSIPLTVTMSRAVGDECQGATFTSSYTVTARAV